MRNDNVGCSNNNHQSRANNNNERQPILRNNPVDRVKETRRHNVNGSRSLDHTRMQHRPVIPFIQPHPTVISAGRLSSPRRRGKLDKLTNHAANANNQTAGSADNNNKDFIRSVYNQSASALVPTTTATFNTNNRNRRRPPNHHQHNNSYTADIPNNNDSSFAPAAIIPPFSLTKATQSAPNLRKHQERSLIYSHPNPPQTTTQQQQQQLKQDHLIPNRPTAHRASVDVVSANLQSSQQTKSARQHRSMNGIRRVLRNSIELMEGANIYLSEGPPMQHNYSERGVLTSNNRVASQDSYVSQNIEGGYTSISSAHVASNINKKKKQHHNRSNKHASASLYVRNDQSEEAPKLINHSTTSNIYPNQHRNRIVPNHNQSYIPSSLDQQSNDAITSSRNLDVGGGAVAGTHHRRPHQNHSKLQQSYGHNYVASAGNQGYIQSSKASPKDIKREGELKNELMNDFGAWRGDYNAIIGSKTDKKEFPNFHGPPELYDYKQKPTDTNKASRGFEKCLILIREAYNKTERGKFEHPKSLPSGQLLPNIDEYAGMTYTDGQRTLMLPLANQLKSELDVKLERSWSVPLISQCEVLSWNGNGAPSTTTTKHPTTNTNSTTTVNNNNNNNNDANIVVPATIGGADGGPNKLFTSQGYDMSKARVVERRVLHSRIKSS